VGLAEQVKSLEATLQIAVAKEAELLRRAAAAESKVLALSAQVTDSQAASHAATAAKSSKHDTSADFATMLPFSQAPSWKQSVIRARKAPSPFKEVSQLPLIPCGDCINVPMHVYSWHYVSSILFGTNHFLTIVPQFLVLSIMQKGLHQTEALAVFLQSSKQAYVELNPAASLDDAEADQIIQELRAELRL
jgi:hypothetical protein